MRSRSPETFARLPGRTFLDLQIKSFNWLGLVIPVAISTGLSDCAALFKCLLLILVVPALDVRRSGPGHDLRLVKLLRFLAFVWYRMSL